MDWFLTLFISVVVGALGYLFYYLSKQSKAEAAETEIWKEQLDQTQAELLAEQTAESDKTFNRDYDVDAFNQTFKDLAAYEESKAADPNSDKTRALLLARACEVVKRAERIERAVKPINEIINTMPNPKAVQEQLMAGVKAMENEMKSVREEADSISSGWGQIIIQQAADLTLNLWRRKEMIKRQKETQVKAQARAKAASDNPESALASNTPKPEEQVDLIAPSTDESDPLPFGKRFPRDVEANAPTPPMEELLRLAKHICHSPEKLKADALAAFRAQHDTDAFKVDYPAAREYEEGKNAEKFSSDELRKELRKRAYEAVKKANRIKKAVDPINIALQRGLVPDPHLIQAELQAGVNALNGEMAAIVSEANVLAPGWGQVILPEAIKLFEATSKLEEKKAAEQKAKLEDEAKKVADKQKSEEAFNQLMKEEEDKAKKKEKKKEEKEKSSS